MSKTHSDTQRAKVYAFIRGRGRFGATDEEAQITLSLPGNTETPRRLELVKAGAVKDSGRKRKTRRNRKAIVWVKA